LSNIRINETLELILSIDKGLEQKYRTALQNLELSGNVVYENKKPAFPLSSYGGHFVKTGGQKSNRLENELEALSGFLPIAIA